MAASRDENNNNNNNITKIGSGNMKASSEDLFKAQKMLGGGGHEQEQQPPHTQGGGGGGGNSRNELLLKDLQDAMCWGSIPNSLLGGGRAAQEMEIDSLMGPPDPALRSQPSPASGASNEGLLEDIVRPGATRRNM